MTTGVLIMAYGTPADPEAVEAYYTHIRRGRPPEPAQLADLRRRYDAIGGISPLTERTRDQVRAIEKALDTAESGAFVVRLGQKHAPPFIEDGIAELLDEGVASIDGLVLAPHYSAGSVGQYHARARAAADEVPYRGIESWHLLVGLVRFQAAAVRQALAGLPPRTVVVFTAHSLPERVLAADPYPELLQQSAGHIAEAAGLDAGTWRTGYQSAGRTPEPWRGPDILEMIAEAGASHSVEGILVVPQGFTSDHLEVLYDLDIEAAIAAKSAGLAFARTPVVNADPAVMNALADLLRA